MYSLKNIREATNGDTEPGTDEILKFGNFHIVVQLILDLIGP